MKSYGDSMRGEGAVVYSGSTQPREGGPGRNPGQGTGTVPNVFGTNTPTVVEGGATNNGKDNLPRRSGQR